MKTLSEYTQADIRELLKEHLHGPSKIPCHCEECGTWVADAEADADYRTEEGDGKVHCPSCGPGTRIVSVIRYHGMI